VPQLSKRNGGVVLVNVPGTETGDAQDLETESHAAPDLPLGVDQTTGTGRAHGKTGEMRMRLGMIRMLE